MQLTQKDLDTLSQAAITPDMEKVTEETNSNFFDQTYRKVNKFIEFTNQYPFVQILPVPFATVLVNGGATTKFTVSLPDGTRAVRIVSNTSVWYSFRSNVQLASGVTLNTGVESNSQLQLSSEPNTLWYCEGCKQVDLYASGVFNASIECYQ